MISCYKVISSKYKTNQFFLIERWSDVITIINELKEYNNSIIPQYYTIDDYIDNIDNYSLRSSFNTMILDGYVYLCENNLDNIFDE